MSREENALEIDVHADGARLVLALRGELDLATVGTLRACLESVDPGVRQVVLDLAELSFMDSTGIGAVVEAHRRFGPDRRGLALLNPRGHVAKVIEVAGLARILPVEELDAT